MSAPCVLRSAHHSPVYFFLFSACRDLTRGQGAFTGEKMRDFVRTQVRGKDGIPDSAADALEAMTPSSYVGLAPSLAKDVVKRMQALKLQ